MGEITEQKLRTSYAKRTGSTFFKKDN